jgi:drug/metabolite transporter (DMT)-like permease
MRSGRLILAVMAILVAIGVAALVFGPNEGFDQPWRGLMTALCGLLLGVCVTLCVVREP